MKKLEGIAINLIIILIIGMAGMEFIQSEEGYTLVGSLLGEMPFSEMIMKIIKTTLGYQNEIPLISTSSVLNDILKLFISAMIKTGVVSVLIGIFCRVPAYSNVSLGERIDLQEEYMEQPYYKIKVLIVNLFASILIVLISNEILKRIYKMFINNGKKQERMLLYVIAVLIVAVIYVWCFSKIATLTITKSILWAIFGKLFPAILEIFGMNVICLLLYASIYTNGFGTNAFGIIFLLLVWCGLADFVQSTLIKAVLR